MSGNANRTTHLSFLALALSTFSLKNSCVSIFCNLTRSVTDVEYFSAFFGGGSSSKMLGGGGCVPMGAPKYPTPPYAPPVFPAVRGRPDVAGEA